MVDNLGIYNSQVESDYDINKHIEQGVQFKDFGKNFYSANEYKFLQESTAPEWQSIVDTCNGENSTKKRGIIEGLTGTVEQANFNTLVSQYARDYNTYTSTLLKNPPTDASRRAAEAALFTQKTNIVSAATHLNTNLQQIILKSPDLNRALYLTNTGLSNNLSDLVDKKYQLDEQIDKYDDDSVNGALESTELNMTSMHYHVFVYLIIVVTLIAFIFNLMVNPNANVLNAIFVVGALLMVYIISKYFVN